MLIVDLKSVLSQARQAIGGPMQMILLMSVISASGFTLVPELPDLIATVGQVYHGKFYIENRHRMITITIINTRR